MLSLEALPARVSASSANGKRKTPGTYLFLSYLRTIQALSPKYFVMENVPGLAMMYEGKTVERIRREVAEMGPTKYEIV